MSEAKDESGEQTPTQGEIDQERSEAEAAFNETPPDAGAGGEKADGKAGADDKGAASGEATGAQGSADPAAAVVVADDRWKDVPPAVRGMLEEIRGKVGAVDALRKDVAANNGRVQKLTDQLTRAATQAAADVARAPTQSQIREASKSSAKWRAQKEDFPEWAEAMEERLAEEREAMAAQFKPQKREIDVDSIQNMVSNAVAASMTEVEHKAEHLGRLYAKYPDWKRDVRVDTAKYDAQGREVSPARYTPEFTNWYQSQPPEVKALAESAESADAILMLDKFYEHKNTVAAQSRKQQQLARAIQPRGTSGQRQISLSEREAEEKAFNSV